MFTPSPLESESDGVRVKVRDLCWTVFVIDPVAVPLVGWLRRFRSVTADRLTVASTLVAVVAALLFATQHFVLGAVVYQLSFLLDCLDGKIASLRGKRHGWGGWFDQAGDATRIAVCSAGLAFGLVAAEYDAPWQVLLLVLYPAVRWSTAALVGSTPAEPSPPADPDTPPPAPEPTHVYVGNTPLQVLRAAPRRRLKPGSTVDTEATAFTLGPLLTVPFWGVVVATLVDALHVAYMLVGGLRAARREADHRERAVERQPVRAPAVVAGK